MPQWIKIHWYETQLCYAHPCILKYLDRMNRPFWYLIFIVRKERKKEKKTDSIRRKMFIGMGFRTNGMDPSSMQWMRNRRLKMNDRCVMWCNCHRLLSQTTKCITFDGDVFQFYFFSLYICSQPIVLFVCYYWWSDVDPLNMCCYLCVSAVGGMNRFFNSCCVWVFFGCEIHHF